MLINSIPTEHDGALLAHPDVSLPVSGHEHAGAALLHPKDGRGGISGGHAVQRGGGAGGHAGQLRGTHQEHGRG